MSKMVGAGLINLEELELVEEHSLLESDTFASILIEKLKVEPCPRPFENTEISPWFAATSYWQNSSPRPIPLGLISAVASSFPNFLKSFA